MNILVGLLSKVCSIKKVLKHITCFKFDYKYNEICIGLFLGVSEEENYSALFFSSILLSCSCTASFLLIIAVMKSFNISCI